MKYNLSIKKGNLTFGIEGCYSFDEAAKIISKGIYDYELKNGSIPTDSTEEKKIIEKPNINEQQPNPNPIQNSDNASDENAGETTGEPENINQ